MGFRALCEVGLPSVSGRGGSGSPTCTLPLLSHSGEGVPGLNRTGQGQRGLLFPMHGLPCAWDTAASVSGQGEVGLDQGKRFHISSTFKGENKSHHTLPGDPCPWREISPDPFRTGYLLCSLSVNLRIISDRRYLLSVSVMGA